VTFTGPRYSRDKLSVLAAADAFALPSFSEGFSMAVLEAMACALPVLLTPGCNFPEVARGGAGIEVAPDAAAVEAGLRALCSMSPAQRRDMGVRGRRMVEQRYTWDAVARQMTELYAWVAGGGDVPATVRRVA
jgi:poly(glycerol-phosphate) alpha-glucosyltransferase